jgi:hypothetical protein
MLLSDGFTRDIRYPSDVRTVAIGSAAMQAVLIVDRIRSSKKLLTPEDVASAEYRFCQATKRMNQSNARRRPKLIESGAALSVMDFAKSY